MPQVSLFMRNFTVMDFAWLTPEQGIRGESYQVSAELWGEVDEKGFILDFGPCKKQMKQVVDSVLDHRCAVAIESPDLEITENGNYLSADLPGKTFQRCPTGALRLPRGGPLSPADCSDHH